MKTGAEIVPTPSEISAQLEMAIDNEKSVLPQADVKKQDCEHEYVDVYQVKHCIKCGSVITTK